MTLLKNSILLLASILLVYVLASATFTLFHDWHSERALSDLQSEGTAFSWEFDSSRDLLPQMQEGMTDLQFSDGILSARSDTNNPAFFLNLRGLPVATDLYQQIQVRLFSEQPSRFALLFRIPGSYAIYQSSPVATQAGWQNLTLDLEQLSWRRYDHDGEGFIPEPHADVWGGSAGAINLLRIDPVKAPGIEFRLDRIQLLPTSGMDIPPGAVALNQLSPAESFGPAVKGPLLVYDRTHWQHPELVLDRYRALQKTYPHALIFSSPELSAPNLGRWLGLHHYFPALALLLMAALSLLIWKVGKSGWLLNTLILAAGALLLVQSYAIVGQTIIFRLAAGLLAINILAMLLRRKRSPDFRLGFGPGVPAAWLWATATSLAVLAVILVVAWWSEAAPRHGEEHWLKGIAIYPVWALLQQLLLGPLLAAGIAAQIRDRNRAAILAALVFSLLHYPNFSLMLATLVMGSVWAAIYLHYRTLWPQILSHAALAIMFRELAPAFMRLEGDVGLAYFSWMGWW